MADVFVSYKREDQEQRGRVLPIVRALEAEGFDVFYDVEVPPGSTWDQVLSSKIADSKCVLVLWSEASVTSDWVKEEAEIAKSAGKLIPVFIEAVQAPFGFSRIEGAFLANWNGDLQHVEWRNLVDAVKSKVGEPAHAADPNVKEVILPAATISKTVTVQKSVDNGNRFRTGTLIAFLLPFIVIAAGAFWLMNLPRERPMGEVAIAKPAEEMSESSGDVQSDETENYAYDLAARARRDKEAWTGAIKENSIQGYEAYLRMFPNGEQSETARSRLARLKEVEAEQRAMAANRPISVGTCYGFDEPELAQSAGTYHIVSGNLMVQDRIQREEDAARMLDVMKAYGINQRCRIGEKHERFDIWLTEGKVPDFALAGEDCTDVTGLSVSTKKAGGMFLLMTGATAQFRFASEADAKLAADTMETHQLTHICRIGNAMSYLRR